MSTIKKHWFIKLLPHIFQMGEKKYCSQKNRSAVRGGGKNHGDKRVREEQELKQQEAQFGEVVA